MVSDEQVLSPWEEVELRWDEVVFRKPGDARVKSGRPPVTIGDVATAISSSMGVMTEVAKALDCHWLAARAIIDTYPFLQTLFEAEKDIVLDMAESVIRGNMRTAMVQHQYEKQLEEQAKLAGNASYIPRQIDSADSRWWLARIGRKRGFGDQVAVQLEAEKPIPIAILQPGELDALMPKKKE